MLSCPRCSYLRTIRKLSRTPPGLGLQSSSSTLQAAAWIHLSARRPRLQAYNRESDIRLLPATRRRRFLNTEAAAAPQESPEAAPPALPPPSPAEVSLQDNDPSTPPAQESTSSSSSSPSSPFLNKELLPLCCPGCGAYAQTIDPNEPGYYSRTRKKTRKLLKQAKEALVSQKKQASSAEQEGDEKDEKDKEGEKGDTESNDGSLEAPDKEDGSGDTTSKERAAPKPAADVLLDDPDAATRFVEATTPPVQYCDRCHNLIHHNQGEPAPSPTVESIRALLEESPHKCNRVYHIVDAADFPMSVIPNIHKALDLQEQRSKNRRAKTEKYKGGKKMTTVSFVITRSDLLAATKEQVDSLMQRIRKMLLDVLGLKQEDVRLGNVHMISAHRGWWTKKVKEEIREHGGGIWVVGKANVGKSSFINSCFPKDSKNLEKVAELLQRRQDAESLEAAQAMDDSVLLNEDSLLPPAPREELYPTLPVVSSLPGTTVSPIRIPFGRGRGEMIDLPGLDRGTLQDFVKDEYKRDLIMTKRIKPERLTIKPGQSLLLGGGLIRITPVTEDVVVLAACFVPLETHVTKTQKAIEIQSLLRPYSTGACRGTTIVKDGVFGSDTISSAGIFELDTDVTHNHLPTLMKKRLEDQGIKPPPLPYKVFSRDLLIEGCGWIELTAQVRAKKLESSGSGSRSENGSDSNSGSGSGSDNESNSSGDSNSASTSSKSSSESKPPLPRVEVFSPHGQHIGSRPPMETWNFIHEKKLSDKRKGKVRPRRQNISQKKRASHGAKV
ncbi:hypothetical protein VTN77DRAFT_7572 [Rasamsonia byssochlamydoides]|uniref:uncharacterized protein n=1 Tax=Rasamsonia byssochlamydoides TaxID=89139 RepID=UPI0037432BFD